MDKWLLIDVGLALTLWFLLAHKTPRLWDRGLDDHRVLTSWLFLVCAALGATWQVDPIYATFDTWIGINNLSWLLSYLAAMGSLWWVTVTNAFTLQRPAPSWIKALSLGTILLLSLLFPTIARTPDRPDHVLAQTPVELCFMVLFYTYALIVGGNALSVFWHWWCVEHPNNRRRSAVAVIATLTALIWLVGKLVYALAGWIWPHSSWVAYLPVFHQLSLTVAGCSLAISFLASGWLDRLLAPYHWLRQIYYALELRWLQQQLLPFHPPYLKMRWLDILFDPAGFLAQARIHVLDSRVILQNRKDEQRAGRLYQALQAPAIEATDLEQAIQACYQVSRQLRRMS